MDQLARAATRCPAAKSRASTSATSSPRVAASSAQPAPVAPPPITTTSKTSSRQPLERRAALLRAELARSIGPSGTSVTRQHGGLHRRDRPGHDEHALHPVRQGRQIVTVDQREHEQITPQAGWVEHDAKEVWRRTREVIGGALANSDREAGDIAAIGITNQRETTVVWDRETGEPVYNAIVWQDTRTDAIVRELRRRRPAARGHRPAALDLLLRARRSSGSSTTSTARASAPRTASWRSGRWTPGCSGT